MPERNDPIDALRDAWTALPTPAADRPLGEEDETTRAAVEWMQAAWSTVEIPVAEPPVRVTAEASVLPFRRIGGTRIRLAAAAALLLAVAGLFLIEAPAWSTDPVEVVEATGPEVPETPSAARDQGTALPEAEAPQLVSAETDRIVMKAGKVRLTLLTPPPEEAAATEESE